MKFALSLPLIKDIRSVRVANTWNATLQAGEISLKYQVPNQKFFSCYESEKKIVFLIGDPLSHQPLDGSLFERAKIEEVLRTIEGFYYFISFDKHKKSLLVATSMFNILPVYFSQIDGLLFVSSSLDLFSGAKDPILNKEYLLERALFNYPLGDNTVLKNVQLLPSNCYLSIADGKLEIVKHTFIEHFFVDKPIPYKKKINDLVDLFLFVSEKYFPADPFGISFTGGFDGRTLVSVAHSKQKPFFAYSFGSKDSQDVRIPASHAKQLGFKFVPFLLDDEYVKNYSFKSGTELVQLSHGEAAFARAHYHYAVSHLSQHTDVILTGNFGSELFRAIHNIGVVISQEFYDLVSCGADEFKRRLSLSPKLALFRPEYVKKHFDGLVEKLLFKKIEIDRRADRLNARFYIWIFEEVFRKYFGPEIVMQFHYLANRTPYLSFPFIKELLKTELAGENSGFFERNMLRRLKGQLFYAYLLQHCWPELAQMKTIKGYRPIDLLSFLGKGRIVFHRLQKKDEASDPFSVKKSFFSNLEKYRKWPIAENIYNKKVLINELNNAGFRYPLDLLINVLSTNYYISTL